jgi:hypothetical protein
MSAHAEVKQTLLSMSLPAELEHLRAKWIKDVAHEQELEQLRQRVQEVAEIDKQLDAHVLMQEGLDHCHAGADTSAGIHIRSKKTLIKAFVQSATLEKEKILTLPTELEHHSSKWIELIATHQAERARIMLQVRITNIENELEDLGTGAANRATLIKRRRLASQRHALLAELEQLISGRPREPEVSPEWRPAVWSCGSATLNRVCRFETCERP